MVLILLLLLAVSSRLISQSYAQESPTVTGVGPWTQLGNYGSTSTTPGQGGIGTLGASCALYSGYVYCVGGQNPSGTDISDVFYAQLSSGGMIGPWTETTDYGATSGTVGSGGTGIEWPSCVESGGYIYCVAGATNSGISSKVYFAQLSSSGVGPWTETTDYGATTGSSGKGGLPVFQLSCVTDSGYVYCVGGGAGSKVFYAQLSSTGVGPWAETTDYGAVSGSTGSGGIVIDSNACIENAGTIYCVGGTSANYSVVSDVFSATLGSSGVGAWTENTDYGSNSTSNGTGGVPIYGTSCVVYSSYVICVGGDTTGNAGTNHVFYGQDGILGWKEAEGYIVSTYWDDCIEFGGYVYCWGQDDPNVYSSPIDTPSSTTSTLTSPSSSSSASSSQSTTTSYSSSEETTTTTAQTTTTPTTTTPIATTTAAAATPAPGINYLEILIPVVILLVAGGLFVFRGRIAGRGPPPAVSPATTERPPSPPPPPPNEKTPPPPDEKKPSIFDEAPCCGPDVTDAVLKCMVGLLRDFYSWSKEDQEEHLSWITDLRYFVNAWDIRELAPSDPELEKTVGAQGYKQFLLPYMTKCMRPGNPCYPSVIFLGQCHDPQVVNYVMWGVLTKLGTKESGYSTTKNYALHEKRSGKTSDFLDQYAMVEVGWWLADSYQSMRRRGALPPSWDPNYKDQYGAWKGGVDVSSINKARLESILVEHQNPGRPQAKCLNACKIPVTQTFQYYWKKESSWKIPF